MADIKILQETREPWVVCSIGDVRAIEAKIYTSLRSIEGARLFVLDGQKMRDFDGLYDEFSTVLEFPDYFGRNFNALDECLCEIDWLEFSVCVLLIKNSQSVLEKVTREDLEAFTSLCKKAGEEWSNPIRLGEEWDRDAVPFHFVLHLPESEALSYYRDLPRLSL